MIIEDIPEMKWTTNLISLLSDDKTITNVEIIDLRYRKNRWDDIMLIIYK